MILLSAALAQAPAEPPSAPEPAAAPPPKDSAWYAVPAFAFDTDDGLGFGARGEYARLEPGVDPYKSAYVLHIFLSTRGYHHHRLRFDFNELGPEGKFRWTSYLAYRQWLNDGYWGMGNDTVIERAYYGGFEDDDPRRKRYRYTLVQPFAHTVLRYQLSEAWSAYASLDGKWNEIRTYEGSLLEEEKPLGMESGLTVQGFAGVIWDTRQPEITPDRGWMIELSGRYAPITPVGPFGGVFLSVRGYRALTDRVSVNGRLMGEWLWGNLPFYEMVHWGGSWPIAGFGGSDTLRGVRFGRFRAPGKAIFNGELRLSVAQHSALGNPMEWLLVPYVDVGTVWGDGSPFGLHPAAGMGIRCVYDETFVGRIDSGVGLDHVLEPDGTITPVPNIGLYVVFDHMF